MTKTLTFRPSRIGCPSIPGTVKGIVMSIPGVVDAKIHYDERSVDVRFDDAKTDEQMITKKIGAEMGLAFEPTALHDGFSEDAAATCPMR